LVELPACLGLCGQMLESLGGRALAARTLTHALTDFGRTLR